MPVTEDYPLTGFGPLAESKIAAEKECVKSRERSNMVVTIFRPRLLSARGDWEFLAFFFSGLKKGGAFRCWAPGTTGVNCWIYRTFWRQQE